MNMDTTTTQRGRQRKPPAKFLNNGSLGAAVGGGGLLSNTSKLLPGITGNTRGASVGAAATDSDGEGGAGRPRQVESAPLATAGKGKGRADAQNVLQRIMEDPDFGGERAKSGTSSDKEDSSDMEATPVNVGDDDGGNSSGDGDSDDDFGLDGEGTSRSGDGSSSGRGSGGGSSGGSSSGGATAAKALQTLQKSLRRNRDKGYESWPASLLREACSLRKIQGYSKCSDPNKMAVVLTQLDQVMERSSPYLVDLDDKAAGGTPSSKPLASKKELEAIPEQLVTATKAAVQMGTSLNDKKLLKFGGKSYPTSAVLAAIQEQERGGGGGESTASRRKSKHCGPRFCEIIALPANRSRWAEHRTQLTKAELDAKVTGKTRGILIETWEQFKDATVEVPSTFADDEHVVSAGIDPSIVHQPDITFDKYIAMKNEIIKEHGDMYCNFKKSGSHGEMYQFCHGNLETYYYGLMVEKYPELEQATTQMLPDGTGSEQTGVGGEGEGGAAAAKAAAERRAGAKKDSREKSVARSGQEKKKQKLEKDIRNTAKLAATAAKEELGLGAGLGSLLGVSPSPTFHDAPTSFFDTVEGCETKAKKIELSGKLRNELLEVKRAIRAEQNMGAEADDDLVKLMQGQVANLMAELKKQTEKPL